MKRTIQATIIGLLILTAGVATAADTATVTVSARVLGTCQFTVGAGALAFGDLPFDAVGNALGIGPITTPLEFWCTNGATYAITDDGGLNYSGTTHRMNSDTLAATEYIDYSFSYAPASGTGAGPGSPIALTVTGSVGPTYTANSPDTYSDTVTLTINP